MLRHPWRRLGAWLVDWLVISVWIGALFAVGVPLSRSGAVAGLSPILFNVLAFVVLVAPVTLFLATLESRGRTIGKRVLSLRVTDAASSGRVPFSRALLRNSLKIALPWAIGHVAVYGFASAFLEATPTWVYVVTALAYVLPVAYLVSLFVRSGRTPYDRLAGTMVIYNKE